MDIALKTIPDNLYFLHSLKRRSYGFVFSGEANSDKSIPFLPEKPGKIIKIEFILLMYN